MVRTGEKFGDVLRRERIGAGLVGFRARLRVLGQFLAEHAALRLDRLVVDRHGDLMPAAAASHNWAAGF